MKPRDQYTDAWGKHQPSAQAREVLWAASYAEHPPAPSTGRHHRLRALALFGQMLASDFGVKQPHADAIRKNKTAKARPPLERDIERYLVKRAKALGGEVRKVQWIGRRSAPDRLVMLPYATRDSVRNGALVEGRPTAIWVELKAPGVAPETHQLREHARMRALGQRVEVIDSFEAVDRLLG